MRIVKWTNHDYCYSSTNDWDVIWVGGLELNPYERYYHYGVSQNSKPPIGKPLADL
jgi:hypothetical protein